MKGAGSSASWGLEVLSCDINLNDLANVRKCSTPPMKDTEIHSVVRGAVVVHTDPVFCGHARTVLDLFFEQETVPFGRVCVCLRVR